MGGALIRMEDGSIGHVRGTGIEPCAICGVWAGFLCDYPMGRGKTCDARLCEQHAIVQGRRPDNQLRLRLDINEDIPEGEAMHFCPAHHLIAGRRK